MDLSAPWMAAAAGTLLGFLTGLGVGGGSLLILWLTVVLHLDPEAARGISLLFFFPSAFISCLFRRGEIPWKTVLPAAAAGCINAGLFSGLSQTADPESCRRYLGLLLIFVGIHELFHRKT